MELWGYSGNDGAWTAPWSSAQTDQHPSAKLGPRPGGVGTPNAIAAQTVSVEGAPLTTSLRVGSILPLTGFLDFIGLPMRDAADLAADEIVAAGVLAGSLEVVHRDSQSSPTAGADAANDLVFVEGVPVIIGAALSIVSLPVADITVPNEVIQISPSSTSPVFTTLEPEEPGWFWRTAASDALDGKAAALRAVARGWTQVGILVMDNIHGPARAESFREHFARDGRSVAVQVNYAEGQADYTSDLQLIANAAPEAVFFIGFPGDGLTIMQNWDANKAQPGWGWDWLFSGGLKSTSFMSNLQAAGIDVTGAEGTAQILEGPNYATFRTAFLARYDREPEIFAAHTYDALYLTALAAAAGQGVDSMSIRDNLIAVANPPGAVVGPGPQEFERAVGILEAGGDINYEGASGLVNFDPVGDVGSSYEIWQVTPTYDIVQVDVIPEGVMWPGLRIIGPWFGSEMDAFLPVLDAFEVGTGILTEYIPTRAGELLPTLDQQFALGETPADVIFMWPWYIRQASRDGHIVHVNHMIDEADFRPGALDEVRVGNTIYGGAYTGKVKPGFWYRQSFFSAHGLTVPTTYADFVALLGEIASISGIVDPIVSGDGVGWPLSDVTEHFLATYGGPEMHRDLTAGDLSWTDPSVKNVFSTYLIPLLEAGYFSAPLQWDTAALDGWWNGQYGLYFMGSWITGMVADPNDLGVFALPPEAGSEQADLTITMRDSLAFEPGSFSVASGESVSLTLINGGALTHTFTLFAQANANVPVNDFSALQDYYNANARLVDVTLSAGQQVSSSFTAPVMEGTYTFVCMTAGHAAGGMHGTMTVSVVIAGVVYAPDYFFIPAHTDVLGNAKLLFQFLAGPEGQTIQVQQGGHIATALGVSLADYPPVDREVAGLLEGRELLFDLDDAIGGQFQTTFWSQLQLLWADPTSLDAVLAALQSLAPTPSANTPPLASFTPSPSAGDATAIFTMDASSSSDAETTLLALEVRWDWEDDGVWDTPWSTDKTASHQYSEVGTHTIRLEVTDTGGLTDSITGQVVVDNAAPTTAATQSGTAGLAGWFISSVVVTLSAVDDLSGTASTSFRIDGDDLQAYTSPFTVDDGIHMVEYFSTDLAGNEEAVKSFDVKIDTVAPETSLTPAGTLGEHGWYTSLVTVTLTASDATSGGASIAYRIDGGALQTYTDPFTVGEGEHTLEYQATDAAGNEETAKSAPLKIDTSKPMITIDAPADGSILDSASVSVSGTASDELSLESVELSTDGTNWVLATGTTSWSGTLTLAEGENTILARATDTSGNAATVSIALSVVSPMPISPLVIAVGIGAVVAAAAAVAALLILRSRGKRKGEG